MMNRIPANYCATLEITLLGVTITTSLLVSRLSSQSLTYWEGRHEACDLDRTFALSTEDAVLAWTVYAFASALFRQIWSRNSI
jgi:hypothetical protein